MAPNGSDVPNANTVDGFFSADTPPVLRIKSGEVVEIDTVNAAGVRDDNPEKFFKDNGVSLDLPAVKPEGGYGKANDCDLWDKVLSFQ